MFRMTVVSNPAGAMILALEGKVGAEALPEIEKVIKNGKQGRRQVALDLGEVTLTDRDAVRFFAGLVRRGIELMNCPVYIERWISREASHAPVGLHNSLLLALAGMTLFMGACKMVGPNYQRPPAPASPAFKEPLPQGWKEATPADATLRGKWWELYHDPQLNALEEQVSIDNQNVHAAEAQFREAKATVRIAHAGLYPLVTVGPTVTASQSPSNFTNSGQVSATAKVRGLYDVPFSASYTADLWGSIRRTITADKELAQATAGDLENAKLLFQSELAQDYFQIHGIDGDAQLLADAVRSYDEFLTLTRNRYDSGVASLGDVAQAQTQLETTRAELVDLGIQRAQLEHAIAILTGKPPSTLEIPRAPIKDLPPPVPVSVPSTLLERRPDIAAAERRVGAANEQIGITMAALYPTLTIAATGGIESSDIAKLFTWTSRFWSVGPTLSYTIFDAGRRHAQVSVAEAAYDVTVANYRQTVLTAIQQVEDNLAALRILAGEADVQDRAVKAAEESLQISTAQYTGGVVSYLQVITSQTTALANERVALGLLTRRMTASVLLIQALGGGWDTGKLPTYDDILPPKPKKQKATSSTRANPLLRSSGGGS
jgi:NodT family efflux transporter outer membrane factor (OMF) lipoprotein